MSVLCAWCDEPLGEAVTSTVLIAGRERPVHADCAKCAYCQKPGSAWRVSEFACEECSDELDRGEARAKREADREAAADARMDRDKDDHG